jgi:hypothetical protein
MNQGYLTYFDGVLAGFSHQYGQYSKFSSVSPPSSLEIGILDVSNRS